MMSVPVDPKAAEGFCVAQEAKVNNPALAKAIPKTRAG